MSNKNKIIVSIVGITIVLLVLLGITYAYYLTRIEGNTNTNSISVTTAKLELVYSDNSEEIITGTGALTPKVGTETKDAIGTKTFTVTNNGNDSSYVVIIDNVRVKKVSDNTDTNFLSNDFRYTLTCTKSDGTKCNEVNDLTIFPIKGGILVSNDIKAEDVHSYTLTMWYIDTGVDQSDDMGKSYQARVNITDVNQMENPFKTGVSATDNASLAYNIINNAKENKNGTKLLNVADTPVAEDIAVYRKNVTATSAHGFYGWDGLTYGPTVEDADLSENYVSGDNDKEKCEAVIGQYISDYRSCNNHCGVIEKVVACENDGTPIFSMYGNIYESSLALEQDDLGISYYYRGAVVDNYVTFAGMCWRIVRINGDGTTKLILEDQDEACSINMNGNWGIPTETGGTLYTGNYGYYINDESFTGEIVISYLNPVIDADKSMVRAFYDFQIDKLANYLKYLKSGDWCYSDNKENQSAYYDSYIRLYGNSINGYKPTLKCTGTIINKFEDLIYDGKKIVEEAPMYVSALTADEMVYAGGNVHSENMNYYLINKNSNFDYYLFWSLSPGFGAGVFGLFNNGIVSERIVDDNVEPSFRPSISLSSGITITGGDGTLKKPYIINEE